MIETPEIMERFMGESLGLEPLRVDHWLIAGETLSALGQRVEVRHVPGHCPGNVLFYFPALQAAFVGDALFQGSVGRTDLPQGDFDELERSIRSQIYTLPAETTVFPGTVRARRSARKNPVIPMSAAEHRGVHAPGPRGGALGLG
jgi:glyoxylase-like metal-dependent hydrolase (beta-lactamase superfamily II)